MEESKTLTTRARTGKLVPHPGGNADPERLARAVNAAPWEPMPGMEKRQCPGCYYLFAADTASSELRCPDCVGGEKRKAG